MLEQIPAVTARTADAIVGRYPTCATFIRAMEGLDGAAAQALLVGILVVAAESGGRDRFIGVTVAKRIVNILTGQDVII